MAVVADPERQRHDLAAPGNSRNGYVRYDNEDNQPIKLDGVPGDQAGTHIPRNPDGSFPVPNGW